MEPKSEQLILRISVTELAMLRALAESTGLSAADVVRTCIRHEYAEKFGDRLPKTAKR